MSAGFLTVSRSSHLSLCLTVYARVFVWLLDRLSSANNAVALVEKLRL